MVCKNNQTIIEKKALLLQWLSDPTTILAQAKEINTAISLSEYLADLEQLIASKFKRGCRPETRTLERERVIVRYVAHVHLEMMNRGTAKKSPLVSHRNQETPVEKAIRTRAKDGIERGPSVAVRVQLQAAPSFFQKNDRARILVLQRSPPIQVSPSPIPAASEAPAVDDFSQLRVATLQETRTLCQHRLVFRTDHCKVHLHHHPMEVYMAWCLHKVSHVYENHAQLRDPTPLQESAGSTFVVSDVGPIERYPGCLIVARPGSTIYDDSFSSDCFSVPIQKLFQFLLEHGSHDPTRSSGWRLEVSNAGLAQDESSATFRPKEICGGDIFEKSSDGPLVRAILGRFMDGLTTAAKALSREMGKPRAINFRRFEEYSQKLQSFFFAEQFDMESLTVQLLCLSVGHGGCEHFDVLNDPRASFDGTVAKVMFFVDTKGRLWSLKILCSFRKRLGDFFSVAMGKVERLMVDIKTMLAEVNASYQRLVQHGRGSTLLETVPTWDNVCPIFLNDKSPWETEVVSKSITQRTLRLLTNAGRGFWLSMAFSAVYFKSSDLDERDMIQLFIVMAWQNSFNRFWEVVKRMDCSSPGRSYALYEYYKVARQLFYEEGKEKGQEMFGGATPRFGPIGFDFKEVFGTYEETKNDTVDGIVDIILKLCDSLNLLFHSGATVSRLEVLSLVEATAGEIRGVGRCELGTFRLMILLQGCAFMKVRLKSGEHLRQMFFPVNGSGSWEHLMDAGVSAQDVEAVCFELQRELSTHWRIVWMDEVEVILCESKDGRLLQKFDTFIVGQMLWRIDDFGGVWVKLYNNFEWTRFVPRHKR
jgi:hypothetical protein